MKFIVLQLTFSLLMSTSVINVVFSSEQTLSTPEWIMFIGFNLVLSLLCMIFDVLADIRDSLAK